MSRRLGISPYKWTRWLDGSGHFSNRWLRMKVYKLKEEIAAMSVQVESLEKNMAKLIIEVPAEELEKAIVQYNKRDRRFGGV